MTFLKNNRGFTLIEALITTLILIIGISALYVMQAGSINGNATANSLTVASTVSGSLFERLIDLPYDDDALDPAGNPHDGSVFADLTLPPNVTSVSWTVTEWTNTDGIDNDGDGDTDEADELDIKLVVLDINYRDRNAKTLTINFYKSEML